MIYCCTPFGGQVVFNLLPFVVAYCVGVNGLILSVCLFTFDCIMIDIVLPLGSGGLGSLLGGDEGEMRYALRSWELNLLGIRDIWVVGERLPSWSKCLNLLYFKETERSPELKEFRIFSKVLYACQQEFISDDFLFVNDDHFILQPFVAKDFPYHYREEDMIDTINNVHKNGAWKTTMRNTREHLVNSGFEAKMFDTHCPIIYNKFQFSLLDRIDWSKPYGYGIKSLYANRGMISGIKCPDGKLFPSEQNEARLAAKIANRPYISTSPIIPKEQAEIIMQLFPEKSRFEK